MSTTRSPETSMNNQQQTTEIVNENMVSPVRERNTSHLDQGVVVTCPPNAKSPRVENSALESLRVSLKETIASGIKSLRLQSQREMPSYSNEICKSKLYSKERP